MNEERKRLIEKIKGKRSWLLNFHRLLLKNDPEMLEKWDALYSAGKFQKRCISDREKELVDLGSVYDIVLLSSGEDGHIGAIYPNHHSFDDDAEMFITMDDSPKPPPKRMSISKKLLKKTGTAIILFKGDAKKDAYMKFLDKKTPVEGLPAKLVKDIDDLYVVTDQDDR